MSARFDGATTYLANAAPSLPTTGGVVTFGCWLRPLATPSAPNFSVPLFCYSDTGSAPPTGRFDVRYQNTGKLALFARDGTNAATQNSTALLVNGSWHYVVARWISTTNRRMSILFPDGSVEHLQNTTSIVPTSMDTITIGALLGSGGPSDFYNGDIGEWWYTDADVQADGAQLTNAMLRQLAYGSPFSLPHIAKSIIEYHSFRSSLPSFPANMEENYWRGAEPAWVNNNGVALGPHAPLPFWDDPVPMIGMM